MDLEQELVGGMAPMDLTANGLSEVMLNIGPQCCISQGNLESMMTRCGGVLSEPAIARVLGMMARNPGNPQEHRDGAWNVEVFVDFLKSRCPNLDWMGVVKCLDYPEFFIPETSGFVILMRGIKRGLDLQRGDFPLELLMPEMWRNTAGQLSFLIHAVAAPPEIFSFENTRRKLSLVEGMQPGESPNQAWLSLDLMECLCKMGDAGQLPLVWKMLEVPLKTCQEVLLLSISCVRSSWGVVQSEICYDLLAACISKAPTCLATLKFLWDTRQGEMLQTVVDICKKDSVPLSKIVDFFQGLEVLPRVLDAMPSSFALDVACCAHQKSLINLERWLQLNLSSNGVAFLHDMMEYVKTKLLSYHPSSEVTTSTILAFFPLLHTALSVLPPEITQTLNPEVAIMEAKALELQENDLQIFQKEKTLAGEGFKSDIESEAKSYFQKIHSEETQLSEVIAMLKAFHDSPDQHEQEVFACMVHDLFEKYQNFGRYSQTELNITAVLLGQLIHQKLVSSITLNMAQRYVLDALRKPVDSKMFKFGLDAIQQFKTELHEYPEYCLDVLQTPQVQVACPALVEHIERILQQDNPSKLAGNREEEQNGVMNKDTSDSVEQSHGVSGHEALNSLRNGLKGLDINIEPNGTVGLSTKGLPLVDPRGPGGTSKPPGKEMPVPQTDSKPGPPKDEVVEAAEPEPDLTTIHAGNLSNAGREVCTFKDPPEKVSDGIAFIFNNLTTTNVEEKLVKLKDLVGEEHVCWLANYIVVKRAAQEANFHALYIQVVELYGSVELLSSILLITAHCVKSLLKNKHIGVEMSDRTLLKNLGNWLGQLTFGKGVAPKEQDLDIKAVLVEAYEKGKMIAVIPFMRKLLGQCKGSQEFGFWNPWIMEILNLLAEIYRLDGLKMNLTFEIEMIFNDFSLNINSVQGAKTLVDRNRELVDNPDFYEADARPKLPPSMPASKPAEPVPQTYSQYEPQRVMSPQRNLTQQGIETNLAFLQAQLQARANMTSPGFQGGLPLGGSPQVPSASPQVIPTDDASFLSSLAWNLQQQVTISQPLTTLSQMVPLRRLVSVSIVHSICATINPIVERSVAIACTTTKELVTKDFAMEPDAQRLQNAAHLMVSSLSGSLAIVTCKEPLKNSLQAQLKEALQEFLPATILDQAVALVLQDNLELACNIIRRACSNKSVKEVDKQLLNDYQVRQKAAASGNPFYDLSVFMKGGGRYPAALPQNLKPTPGHLTPEQTVLYNDFARIPLNHRDLQAGMMESAAAQATAAQLDRPDSLIPPYMTINLGEQIGQPTDVAEPPLGNESIISEDRSHAESGDVLKDNVAALFDNWVKAIHADGTDKSVTTCVEKFIRSGLLKGDEITSDFFRICAELSVAHCLETEAVNQLQQKSGDGRMSFLMVDSFVKLMVILLQVLESGMSGLRKILGIVVEVLKKDSKEHGAQFNSRPYYRIIFGLFEELVPEEPMGSQSQEILATFTAALLSCRPQVVPGFAFSWLDLVSHRIFMPKLLMVPDRGGWVYFRTLIHALLSFLQPYLRQSEMIDSLKVLYKGLMRVMLVLLHDFPDLLCEHYMEFCNVIPYTCIQIRNIVLSAVPSTIKLSELLKADAHAELLSEMNKEPVFHDVSELMPIELKNGIEQYVMMYSPPEFLDMIIPRIFLSQEAAQVEGSPYNSTVLNSIVQYTGTVAVRSSTAVGTNPLQNRGAMDIFRQLANGLDTEGCYYFLNAIANQLRYPNSHTQYFSGVMLTLFLEAQHRGIQEQITRILLERLIAEKPHPWGLVETFMELTESKHYGFWDLGIAQCAPEIGKLCESVARLRMQALSSGAS